MANNDLDNSLVEASILINPRCRIMRACESVPMLLEGCWQEFLRDSSLSGMIVSLVVHSCGIAPNY